jgi:hypothetical protein
MNAKNCAIHKSDNEERNAEQKINLALYRRDETCYEKAEPGRIKRGN